MELQLALLLTCLVGTAFATCPTDQWTFYNGFCYFPSPSGGNWQAARATCQAIGADLASIHDHLEQTFCSDLMAQAKAWIGLNDRDNEGSFVWSDGTAANYVYWASGQPDNYGNEDCVYINFDPDSGKWDDGNCELSKRFLCKIEDQ